MMKKLRDVNSYVESRKIELELIQQGNPISDAHLLNTFTPFSTIRVIKFSLMEAKESGHEVN